MVERPTGECALNGRGRLTSLSLAPADATQATSLIFSDIYT